MKITLIGSYNLADGYLGAFKALKARDVDVGFIPAHLYFSENPEGHVNQIIEDLKNQDPDYVLWWRAETLRANEVFTVKKAIKKPFLMFSWDDPHQFESRIKNVKDKIKFFDICFSCCEGSLNDYLDYGCPKSIYCPPGFDPEVHFPEEDDKYKCDISLVCTNLYHGNSITKFHHLSRKVLMELLIDLFPDLDIRIYGSESLGHAFPNHYKGWIAFNDSRKVFYNSKISISTHIRPDGYKYINERVCQILGSKGFLLVDQVNGMEEVIKNNHHCCYMDLSSREAFGHQVKSILDNNEFRESILENGYEFATENLSWANWSDIIIKGLKENYDIV